MLGYILVMTKTWSSHWRKVAKRLFVEARLPILIAVGWTGWYRYSDGWWNKETFAHLFASFTMMSFLFGNVFRVDHKVSQEETLDGISDRSVKLIGDLDNVSQKLEEQTRKIVGLATGGDSQAEFVVRPLAASGGDILIVSFANKGEFPVYDVCSKLIELPDPLNPVGGGVHQEERSHPVLRPSMEIDAYFLVGAGRESALWQISLQTRNNYSSLLKVRVLRVDGVLKFATRWSYGGGVWKLGGDLTLPGYDPQNPAAFFDE